MKILTPAIIILLIVMYRIVFGFSLFSGGDFFFPLPGSVQEQVSSWSLWSPMALGGLGAGTIHTANIDMYSQWIPAIFLSVGIPAVIVQKLFFVIPLFVLSFLGIHRLSKRFSVNVWVSYLVYMANTYILMIVYGGQFGIALSYATVPLAFSLFLNLVTPIHAVVYSWILGLLLLFDLRIALVYLLLCLVWRRGNWLNGYVLPWGLAILYHSYLWYPVVFGGLRPIAQAGSALTGISAPAFYSFADFSHSFSLLHPNWPENIFGKTYFMRPEFLALPFIAYMALLKKPDKYIRLFTVLGIAGAFFSKGVNDPFGFLYQWAFEKIPGFSLFRDPSKFYVLTALSYSILIAATVKKYIPVFFVVWILLLRSAVFFPLGPVSTKEIPDDYKKFSQMLFNDFRFYRTLWVGNTDVFSPNTQTHPAVPISSVSGFYDIRQNIDWLKERYRDGEIKLRGVGYIVVPIDTQGRIFVVDRTYDDAVRQVVIHSLDTIPWLVRLPEYQQLAVYRVTGYSSLVFTDMHSLEYSVVHPYQIVVDSAGLTSGDRLVFNQAFDPRWELWQGREKVHPDINTLGQMVFTVPETGHPAELYYGPQTSFLSGLKLSGIYSILSLCTFLYLKRGKS